MGSDRGRGAGRQIRWAAILSGVVMFSGMAGRVAAMERDSLFEAVARRGIDHVYNLEFDSARSDFSLLCRMHPGHPAGPFFQAMVHWWQIVIDMDNTSYDAEFNRELDAVIAQCDSLLDLRPDDVTAIFFKGGAIGFQGRLAFHRDNYLAAANAGRRALPLVQRASSLDPANVDILLGSGIYNYYAEVIPDEYPIVKPLILFIPPGDRRKGIEQLTTVSQHGLYASVEASYFLMQIYYYYEKDYSRALEIAQRMSARFPRNSVFQRYIGRWEVSLNIWDAARRDFAETVARARARVPSYTASVEREAEYYLGAADLQDGAFDDALAHLFRCDELSRALDRGGAASGFMAMANLKIGQAYDLQGKRPNAVEQYHKVLGMKEYHDSHTLANRYLNIPYTR
jgi:tetratricopeptide (TPR) repeat protein